jgi:hypothetical protein
LLVSTAGISVASCELINGARQDQSRATGLSFCARPSSGISAHTLSAGRELLVNGHGALRLVLRMLVGYGVVVRSIFPDQTPSRHYYSSARHFRTEQKNPASRKVLLKIAPLLVGQAPLLPRSCSAMNLRPGEQFEKGVLLCRIGEILARHSHRSPKLTLTNVSPTPNPTNSSEQDTAPATVVLTTSVGVHFDPE